MDFLADLRSFPLTVLRPGQSWDPCSNCIVIGPSPVDLSAHLMGERPIAPPPDAHPADHNAARHSGVPAHILAKEAKQIRSWRRYDWDRFGQ